MKTLPKLRQAWTQTGATVAAVVAFVTVAVTSGVAGQAPSAPREPAKPPGGIEFVLSPAENAPFPYVIDFVPYHVEWGRFSPGDDIVITSVRGDRPHIEPGGTYLVEGTCTLASMDQARLGLSVTVARNSPGARSAVSPEQVMQISHGTGRFSLRQTMRYPGRFHVSFNPLGGGSSRGTVYFREAGSGSPESSATRRR